MIRAKLSWRKQRRVWKMRVFEDGNEIFTRSFRSKAEGQAVTRRINVAGSAGDEIHRPTKPGSTGRFPVLREGLPKFIDQMVANGTWSGSTPVGYLRALTTRVFPHPLPNGKQLGDLHPHQVTREMLGAILEGTRSGPTKVSIGVREQIRCPLVKYYRWLVDQGYNGPNPTVDLKRYMGKGETKKQRRSKPYPFFRREDEDAKLFAAFRKYRPRYLGKVATMLLAGARYGEATALELDDILWEEGTIYLKRSWSDKANQVKVLKNEECRHVPLGKPLAAILRQHITDYPSPNALVFPSRSGTVQRYSSFLEHVWMPVIRKSGLNYRVPHATRHTFATWLVADGEAMDKVRDWMGHATIDETERYAHTTNLRATAVVDAVGAHLVAP